MPATPYITAARAGRNQPWRFFATFGLVLLLVLLGAWVPHWLLQMDSGARPDLLASGGMGAQLLQFALRLFPYVFVPIGLWIGLNRLHGRSFFSLLNADWSFHWQRFFLSAGLWLGLLALADLLLAWLMPGRYALVYQPRAFFPFLIAALLLIPIQAAGEELLYRGYLSQAFGLFGGTSWAWLAPGLLFALLHYDPRVGWQPLLPLLALSLLLGWITLRSGGLELAFGLHVVHNLYAVMLVGGSQNPLAAPALWSVQPGAQRVLADLLPPHAALSAPLLALPLDLLVYLVLIPLYLLLLARLGRRFFPFGLFNHPLSVLQKPTQPLLSALVGLFGLLALLSLSGCAPAENATTPGSEAAPAIVLEDCVLRGAQAQFKAQCGTLAVAEDPNQPGRQITLNVAVIRSVSREPAPDPLFLLAGGPGQAATEAFLPSIGALERVRFKRDLVLVDQRGTGQSNPLRCPAAEPTPEIIGAQLPDEQQLVQLADCRQELGADPRLYTTTIAAQDLEQVRQALGYEQVNLLGVSYGTRAALAYLRTYPQRVRSLVLDGVVPPNWTLGVSVSADAQRALDLIFTRCRADEACQQTFPDLPGDFAHLRAALAEQPQVVTIAHPTGGQPVRVQMDAETLGGVVRLMSYSDLTAALLPLGIHSAAEGDFSLLASMFVQVSQELDSSMSVGMNQSVICAEDAPLLPPEGESGDFYLPSVVPEIVAACQVWLPDAPAPQPWPAQTWDTPALLISGEADPVTPPANGEAAAAWLPNSTHLVLPGMGHNNFYTGCLPEILRRFIEQPDDTPDTACLETLQPMPFFLSPAGPAP